MGDRLFTDIVTIATGVVSLAIIATIVSKNANTSGVISSAGTSFSSIIKSAVSPVSSSSSLGGL